MNPVADFLAAPVLATSVLQSESFIYVLYIIAFALFIQGLRGLAGPTTAVRGNRTAAVGMAIAVIATLLYPGEGNWGLIALGIALGVAVGVPAARQVKMTAMPQMVALFNGVGGGAVALISWVEFRHHGSSYGSHTVHIGAETPSGLFQTGIVIHTPALPTYVAIFSVFAAIVGSISFWGSNIAFGKLQEVIPGRPISLGAAQQAVNFVLLVLALAAGVYLVSGAHSELLFIAMLVIAALLGNAVVLPIGGADMPVVISMLNACTGLSAAATGMALDNPALIVAGMIVGASGSILTNLMAVAMNRSIPAIIAGGFGGGGAVAGAQGAGEHAGTVKSTTAADAAIQLAYASRVMIVPGYGMAVAQAQHAVRELTKELENRGVEVAFAIHPVAGRMPGHMNVLLAEADVPYDQLEEMDEANAEFQRTDVSLVIGANDVTNPAANNTPSSPIYGMPILEVDDSRSIIVIKRSMNPGFAGIENELYFDPKTSMLFGDAKTAVSEITAELAQV
ncbi:MAG TPA: NAD(P)(+) transhydrogenase (Re/Si-specific) subunit beta [Solirubrobacteraceae bacterium]|nr:NAD(P)(+) transhydrogenase (Re/Si-specific) subunit beta [Solirubrobacteraceae bacterium]